MDLDTCLEVINQLEAIRGKLENGPFAHSVAQAVYDSQNLNMDYWNNVAISALALNTTQQTPFQVQLTPDTLLTREMLAWILNRWAKNIRVKIFGSEEKPFESYDEALEWIFSQSEEIERREGEKLGKQGKFSTFLAYFLSLPFNLGKPEKGYYHIRFKKGSKIFEFVKEINKAVRTVRLEQVSLIAYVLLDAKPFVLPYEITATIRNWTAPAEGGGHYCMQGNKVTVDIYSDISFSEWKQLYKQIKKIYGNERGKRKALEQRHLELYRIVEQKGFPPAKRGIIRFWQDVLSEWNENHKNNQYSSWKEIQRAYDRAMERIASKLFYTGLNLKQGSKSSKVKKGGKQS